MFLEISQNSQKNTCARVSLVIKLQASNVIKEDILAQVFSCEFCEVLKNIFLTEHLWATASVDNLMQTHLKSSPVNFINYKSMQAYLFNKKW